MKIFFDTEFTGLHQNTTLISICLISENDKVFYAELNDFDSAQVNDWIQAKVVDNLFYADILTFGTNQRFSTGFPNETALVGETSYVKEALTDWLSQFDQVEMWSDCLAYDWVLFNNIFGDAFSIPQNVYYIPFDICTLFKIKGIDPDINRELFINESGNKHNAMWDARIIKLCYEKLINL